MQTAYNLPFFENVVYSCLNFNNREVLLRQNVKANAGPPAASFNPTRGSWS